MIQGKYLGNLSFGLNFGRKICRFLISNSICCISGEVKVEGFLLIPEHCMWEELWGDSMADYKQLCCRNNVLVAYTRWRTCMITRQPEKHDIMCSQNLVFSNLFLACLTRKTSSQLSFSAHLSHLRIPSDQSFPTNFSFFSWLLIRSKKKIIVKNLSIKEQYIKPLTGLGAPMRSNTQTSGTHRNDQKKGDRPLRNGNRRGLKNTQKDELKVNPGLALEIPYQPGLYKDNQAKSRINRPQTLIIVKFNHPQRALNSYLSRTSFPHNYIPQLHTIYPEISTVQFHLSHFTSKQLTLLSVRPQLSFNGTQISLQFQQENFERDLNKPCLQAHQRINDKIFFILLCLAHLFLKLNILWILPELPKGKELSLTLGRLKIKFIKLIKDTGKVITPKFEFHTKLNHTSPTPLLISGPFKMCATRLKKPSVLVILILSKTLQPLLYFWISAPHQSTLIFLINHSIGRIICKMENKFHLSLPHNSFHVWINVATWELGLNICEDNFNHINMLMGVVKIFKLHQNIQGSQFLICGLRFFTGINFHRISDDELKKSEDIYRLELQTTLFRKEKPYIIAHTQYLQLQVIYILFIKLLCYTNNLISLLNFDNSKKNYLF
ncbi:hypothetical protein VP01_8g4 [Puccinia sorghi]|uniref:Uncharacterized protein n=1 Tax=Puccinia sorghi TaxID=27349 RepID=A0A0L6U7R7_9BASI|nr:hypothetical protein VP01_8g4 [Puccinia sorghi]